MNAFDNTVPVEVELMGEAPFKNWISSKHVEISAVASGGLSKPARTMLRQSVEQFTKLASVLRDISKLEDSRGEGKLTLEKKEEILCNLRDLYENARKSFGFAITNAQVKIYFEL